MRITRRQLNKIIKESLGIQINELKSPKQVAQEFKDKKLTRKIGKNLKAWNGSTGQKREELEKQLNDQKEELRTAYDAGAFDEMNLKQKAAAKALMSTLKTVLEDPKPQAITKAAAEVEKIIGGGASTKKPEPETPELKPWNPDPDPKVNWEYQVRECVWFTRKKEATKEYKLGHASGKPLEKGGKFLNTIVKLNNAYSELVKDCDPMVKKPTPKPGKKAMVWPENAINLIKTTKMPGEQDFTGIPDWKKEFQDSCSFYIKTNGRSLAEFYQGMNPGIKFTSVHEWLAQEEFQNSRDGRDVAESLIDAVNEMSKEAASKLKGLNNHDSELNPLSGDQMNESLSRGSLYRNRYRRY